MFEVLMRAEGMGSQQLAGVMIALSEYISPNSGLLARYRDTAKVLEKSVMTNIEGFYTGT